MELRTGAYTAPNAFGTYTVKATSTEDSAAYGTATVTVRAQAGEDKAFTYDLNGNLTSDGERAFEWDAENRLVSITITATGHQTEFGYDELGRRVMVRELDPDESQTLQVTSDKKYLWDGVEIAEERDATGGTVLKRFFAQGFVDTDGTVLYHTKDHLGSIRELTDMSQTVRARYEYDPYGRMTKVSGDRDSAFTYTGHFWHAQSGLNFTLFRAYDPNLGRWISADPIEELGGLNLYGYVGNDPVNWNDPSGLAPGDKRFGLPKEFWNWYHRNVKRPGDKDLNKDDARKLYDEWKDDLDKPGPDKKRKRDKSKPDDDEVPCEDDKDPAPDAHERRWIPTNPLLNPYLWKWMWEFNRDHVIPNLVPPKSPSPYPGAPPPIPLPPTPVFIP